MLSDYFPEVSQHPAIIAQLKAKLLEEQLYPDDPMIIDIVLRYVRRIDQRWQEDWHERSPLFGPAFRTHYICPLCAIRDAIRESLHTEFKQGLIPEREFRRLWRRANTCVVGVKARAVVQRIIRQQLKQEWGRP